MQMRGGGRKGTFHSPRFCLLPAHQRFPDRLLTLHFHLCRAGVHLISALPSVGTLGLERNGSEVASRL